MGNGRRVSLGLMISFMVVVDVVIIVDGWLPLWRQAFAVVITAVAIIISIQDERRAYALKRRRVISVFD